MTDSSDEGLDAGMRAAAFARIQELTAFGDTLGWEEISKGFEFEGRRIHLASRALGIFKPKPMPFVLSIRTSVPKQGRKLWYDDQLVAHAQIYDGQDGIDYAFMGNNPDRLQNRWLREACDRQLPLIYFLGVSPAVYQAIHPVFVGEWDIRTLKARVVFSSQERTLGDGLPGLTERRYALTATKRRLHQATFRAAVIAAYGCRCALSGLRVSSLLDAAHIVPDAHENLGQPVINNGLPLSRIHHAAFDSNLIGIDPDCRIHVSGGLLEERDGPMLEAIKQLDGKQLLQPLRAENRPDRNRLEVRFAEFMQAN